jgi:hypothetical protein
MVPASWKPRSALVMRSGTDRNLEEDLFALHRRLGAGHHRR